MKLSFFITSRARLKKKKNKKLKYDDEEDDTNF